VGVPIISTPVGGIPEAVVEKQNGFLITPGDVNALSEKIVKLGKSKQLREKMGRESQKIFRKNLKLKISLIDLEKFMPRLLKNETDCPKL
jgi:glycosyltransferase involved in cell wall biosynthesis